MRNLGVALSWLRVSCQVAMKVSARTVRFNWENFLPGSLIWLLVGFRPLVAVEQRCQFFPMGFSTGPLTTWQLDSIGVRSMREREKQAGPGNRSCRLCNLILEDSITSFAAAKSSPHSTEGIT